MNFMPVFSFFFCFLALVFMNLRKVVKIVRFLIVVQFSIQLFILNNGKFKSFAASLYLHCQVHLFSDITHVCFC